MYKLIIFYSFLYVIYILHPHTSEFLLSVTLDRLLFQISGFFILPIIMLFHFLFSNKINKNNFKFYDIKRKFSYNHFILIFKYFFVLLKR